MRKFKNVLVVVGSVAALSAVGTGVASASTTCGLEMVYSASQGWHQEMVCHTTNPGCRVGSPC